MPSATVFSSKVEGPATHALVIGVGHYPHLPGGSARTKFPNHDGMRQLQSPPESARQIARWLIENYQCASRPLATVALLVSEKSPQSFAYSTGGRPKSARPKLAAMANVASAILEWRFRGEENPDNTLLFYFCGHGISAGTELALLMADFGKKPQAPLDGALDFRRFHANMDECAARQQCYFVDACRVGSELLTRNRGFAGNPVIQWGGTASNPGGRLRLGPVFFSSLAGAPAYAKPNQPSVFTRALIESLGGAASGDETGPWEVRTSRLQEALDFLMRESSRELGIPQAQIPSSDNFAQLTLNTVQTPTVPVVVRVEPQAAHEQATLRCEGTGARLKRPPRQQPWRMSVQTGKYSFFADFNADAFQVQPLVDEIVRPPYWGKPLRVV